MSDRICRTCNGPLVSRRQRCFCSNECRLAGEAAAARRRTRECRRLPGPCPECGGIVVYGGVGAPKKFCSRKCCLKSNNRRTNRKRLGVGLSAPMLCGFCGDAFIASKRNAVYCSRKCYLAGNKLRPKFSPKESPCANCGAVFSTKRYDHRFCSIICRKRFDGRERARRRRSGKSECDYSDAEIFERDGWRCHLCGLRIRKNLSRMHPRGATIDHLLPLILGGEDVKANVAASHRECNVAKNRSAMGEQLRLLG